MQSKPSHISWLVDTGTKLQTIDGKEVQVWELRHRNDDKVLSKWAKHFREHYCLDSQIDRLRSGTGKSRKEYLHDIKFPDRSVPPGPSIRSGDFAEILAADFLEYNMGFWVPRTRYIDKIIRNESSKGSDTIGFLFHHDGTESPRDTLAIFESKAQFSGDTAKPRLQDAVNDSAKDIARKAESLNAIKQRFLDIGNDQCADKVERFQDEVDNPYQQIFGAIAHFDSRLYIESQICDTKVNVHPHFQNLHLVVIKGADMMRLVHDLYDRAAHEA